ncbi:MAG TPA: nitroreductase family deazaflavin-dependent oxidoreductase [Pseudonocardiaceae bacterium]|jgi:deazaflavin-dependent oxidoreductase (nitroreductase family)|nr:nitroreductase family deazaflavin-dependent oxidoreductase [Pseudonocardiaceae bacterium]
MVVPRAVARFNRDYTNKVLGRFAHRLPMFGVVEHVGRKSGRSFRTPVSVFAMDGRMWIALTYGPDSDWVRNVRAAGGCSLVSRGRKISLTEPELVHDPSRRPLPWPARQIMRAVDVSDFLALRPV